MTFITVPFRLLLADIGIPMISLALPLMLILLIPVVVIEGLLCRRWLGFTMKKAMTASAVSNLVSTLIGIPVAWGIMVGVEFGTMSLVDSSHLIQNWRSPIGQVVFLLLGSAWIPPVTDKNAWLIPAATLVLLAPFFLASYIIEYRVWKSMVGLEDGGSPNLSYPRVRLAVRNANLATYGAMFLATTIWLLISLPHH